VYGGTYEDSERELSDEIYVECKELHACDAVDDPAANDGLFSKFSQETVAGQITEFLDLHPQVWAAIQTNPSIIEALGRHGKNVDEFIERYRAYRGTKKEQVMTEEVRSEELAEVVVSDADAPDTQAVDVAVETEKVDAPEAADVAVEAVEEVEEATPEEVTDETPALSRGEFVKIANEFGDAVAVMVMRDGGDYSKALKIAYEAEREAKTKLAEQVAALESTKNGKPVPMVEAPKNGKPDSLFKTGK